MSAVISVMASSVKWRFIAVLTASSTLAYAEAVTATPPRADEAIRTALKRHFTEDAITEMTALIAFQNLSARFNAALDIPAQGLCATFNETPHA